MPAAPKDPPKLGGTKENKPVPDDTKVSVARLCTAAEKLLQETERLRRDVSGLNQRVQPIEHSVPGEDWVEQTPPERRGLRGGGAPKIIIEGRTKILNCQHQLSATRAPKENLQQDANSPEGK